MKAFRKITAAVMAAAVALSLAGCSKPAKVAEKPASSAPKPAPAAASTPTPTPAPKLTEEELGAIVSSIDAQALLLSIEDDGYCLVDSDRDGAYELYVNMPTDVNSYLDLEKRPIEAVLSLDPGNITLSLTPETGAAQSLDLMYSSSDDCVYLVSAYATAAYSEDDISAWSGGGWTPVGKRVAEADASTESWKITQCFIEGNEATDSEFRVRFPEDGFTPLHERSEELKDVTCDAAVLGQVSAAYDKHISDLGLDSLNTQGDIDGDGEDEMIWIVSEYLSPWRNTAAFTDERKPIETAGYLNRNFPRRTSSVMVFADPEDGEANISVFSFPTQFADMALIEGSDLVLTLTTGNKAVFHFDAASAPKSAWSTGEKDSPANSASDDELLEIANANIRAQVDLQFRVRNGVFQCDPGSRQPDGSYKAECTELKRLSDLQPMWEKLFARTYMIPSAYLTQLWEEDGVVYTANEGVGSDLMTEYVLEKVTTRDKGMATLSGYVSSTQPDGTTTYKELTYFMRVEDDVWKCEGFVVENNSYTPEPAEDDASKKDIEARVEQIRVWYDEIENGAYDSDVPIADAATARVKGNTVIRIAEPPAWAPMAYEDVGDQFPYGHDKYLYFHDGELIFIFAVGYPTKWESRIYYDNGEPVRYIGPTGKVCDGKDIDKTDPYFYEVNVDRSSAKDKFDSCMNYCKLSGTPPIGTIGPVQGAFYGVWCGAYNTAEDASPMCAELEAAGFPALVFVTTDWDNLNPKKFYVVTAGAYPLESDADKVLKRVQELYPGAYVKYSGKYIG